MTKFFILDDNNNVIPATEAEWQSFPEDRRVVGETVIESDTSPVTVVTRFDGEQEEDDEPSLFETWYYIPDDQIDDFQDSYNTWVEAETGHEEIVGEWISRRPGAKRMDRRSPVSGVV